MNIFDYRSELVSDYASFLRSFIRIRNQNISEFVEGELEKGVLWPDPLLQLNPSFEPGARIDELVSDGVLHKSCSEVFRGKSKEDMFGKELRLHRHQEEAVHAAQRDQNYVLTTGTGSGKSLSYIIPIVDHVLKQGPGRGIQAIVIYPMNALANSQKDELDKFLKLGFPEGGSPVTYRTYGLDRRCDRFRFQNHSCAATERKVIHRSVFVGRKVSDVHGVNIHQTRIHGSPHDPLGDIAPNEIGEEC